MKHTYRWTHKKDRDSLFQVPENRVTQWTLCTKLKVLFLVCLFFIDNGNTLLQCMITVNTSF